MSKVVWFLLFVYSLACKIKWFPVDFQALHTSWWGLLYCFACACDKLNNGVADKEQLGWQDDNTSLLYFLLWPCTWKGRKISTHVLVHLMSSGPRLTHDSVTSGSYCMVTDFEFNYSEECLQQRCQDSASVAKPAFIVLSQYLKRAIIAWDMVHSMPFGWGLRSLLPWLHWVQYPNLCMVPAL